MCVALCVPALNHGEGYISREPNVGDGAERDATLMNGNPYAHWERRGISLHLVPWGAVLCRGVPWLASGFPGGLWTDGAAFR